MVQHNTTQAGTRPRPSKTRQRNQKKKAAAKKPPPPDKMLGIVSPYLGQLAPKNLRVKLTYKDELFPTTTSGSVYSFVYRGNSLFDPDLTGTGHQPMGYDQYNALYTFAQVTGSKMTLRGTDTASTSNISTYYISLVPTVSSSDVNSYQPTEAGELAEARAAIFHNHQSNQQDNLLVKRITTADILGANLAKIPGAADYSHLDSTNPTYGFFWHINIQDVEEASSLADVQLFITIEYEVIFWARRSTSES